MASKSDSLSSSTTTLPFSASLESISKISSSIRRCADAESAKHCSHISRDLQKNADADASNGQSWIGTRPRSNSTKASEPCRLTIGLHFDLSSRFWKYKRRKLGWCHG